MRITKSWEEPLSCGQVQIVTIQTLDVQGDLERIEDRMLTSGQVK